MTRIRLTLGVLAVVAASCSGATSSSSCAEYAAEIQDMIAADASGEDLSDFISDTEEHAARLIANDPDNAGPCVDAILEAMFTGAFDELETFLDE